MISVRLKKLKFLTFNKKNTWDAADKWKVFFHCPWCDKMMGHMMSEITPVVCDECGRFLPNVKGMMKQKNLRVNWHFGKLH